MQTFLDEVLTNILYEHQNLDDLVFVLPSNRAVRSAQKIISRSIDKPVFAPKITNIENFVKDLSGLQLADDIQLSIELYKHYTQQNPEKEESFSSFTSWANQLISDFNEIDRYLVSPEKLFDYLTAIARIKEWSENSEQTKMIASYVDFSKSLPKIYAQLNQTLFEKGIGYQGIIYRKAVANLPEYIKVNKSKKHFFLGLNALNESEKNIIHTILKENLGFVYWDIDPYFLKDKLHDTGLFIRQYLKEWDSVKHKLFLPRTDYFPQPKKIHITSVAKNQSQLKLVGHLLKTIDFKQQRTALVLADESLLPLLLNSLDVPFEDVNITMGYPLKDTNICKLTLSLYHLQELASNNGWYHKDIIDVLTHPLSSLLFEKQATNAFIEKVRKDNLIFISKERLKEFFKNENLFAFFDSSNSPFELINTTNAFLKHVIEEALLNENQLERSAALLMLKIVETASEYLTKNPFLNTNKSVISLLENLIAQESISFKGNPDQGLQIMGVLETRGLDFENVIITSLNEGILPAGKTTGSFIPYDVKRTFNLPTSKEKDAVYTYHFYRLLQRAKNIHLIYNSDTDSLEGGEKSRFILQLQTDPKINKYIINQSAAAETPAIEQPTKKIKKTEALLKELHAKAKEGLSPSSLSSYIRNPYEFYLRNILRIKDVSAVEDQVAHNVFGTIIHDALDVLYSPFLNNKLTKEQLQEAQSQIEKTAFQQFEKHYPKNSIVEGRNVIVFNVIQTYVQKVIEFDLKTLNEHELTILSLEEYLSMPLYDSNKQVIATLHGKMDRVDVLDGKLRILDYKTGNVENSGLKISSFEEIFENKKYDKAFQLLCYALLVNDKYQRTIDEAIIIPVKKMNEAPLKLFFTDSKNHTINTDILIDFKEGLLSLIGEIFNREIPFEEKE